MKSPFLLALPFFIAVIAPVSAAEGPLDPARAANTVILDETGVKNLRLETALVEEREFEHTIFAIGRVEEIPGNQHSISSRIPGRAIEVNAFVGAEVKAGDVLVKVESRQPGDPPPVIELRALHDGIVIESDVLQGQPVQPDAELLDIADRDEMWVVARIPEQLAAGISPGTKARITFPSIKGEPILAQLLRFGVTADRTAGALEGIFQISNPDRKLTPGMRAEFEIILSTRPSILAVPEEAVQGDPAKRVVYLKDFDLPNAFVKSPVVLGEKGGGWVEVLSGVFPGDEVVTRGSYMLGFAGGGGMSLKEALDAAHGHAHSEDGSELTEADKGKEDDGHGHGAEESGGAPAWMMYYAGGSTLLMLFFAQLWWNAKRREARSHA